MQKRNCNMKKGINNKKMEGNLSPFNFHTPCNKSIRTLMTEKIN